jgi:SpoIID/LytB domain protein
MLRHLSEANKLYSMNCRILDEGSAVRFADGRGWGHGVGLCQWGAQGKALQGHTAEEILSFYYRGARVYQAYASRE